MYVRGQLPADAWMQRSPVDAGWARAIRHGPMSIDQVLARGLQQMLDDDQRQAEAVSPVRYVGTGRRRTLLGRLLRR